MSNTLKFAEKELDLLVKSSIDPDNRPIIEPFIPEILQLVDKFGNSGQSGGSAPYTAKILSMTIEQLCLHEPICPITGEDDEWMDVTELTNGQILYQNKRCSALFKGTNDLSYYLDAIVFVNEEGMGWSGSATLPDGTTVTSRQYVKEFPFVPKTFKIKITEKEIEKDDYEMVIDNPEQLTPVFEYYNKF